MWADVHHTQNNSQTWSDESLPRRMVWRSLWTKRYGVSRGVVKKKNGGVWRTRTFCSWEMAKLMKAKLVGLACPAQPQPSLEWLYECHGPHEWSTSEDRNVGPD